MKLKIIESGSNGNCSILSDIEDNQIILDCGIKYERICTELKWNKNIIVLISHIKHKDHSLAMNKLKSCGIDIYSHENLHNGQLIAIGTIWKILPIELPHDETTTSFCFIIYNSIERKNIFFATDCTALPQLADKQYDLFMVETNYDETTAFTNTNKKHIGFTRHLSVEYVSQWLNKYTVRPKHLCVSHLSNSGNIDIQAIQSQLKDKCYKLYMARKGLTIEI